MMFAMIEFSCILINENKFFTPWNSHLLILWKRKYTLENYIFHFRKLIFGFVTFSATLSIYYFIVLKKKFHVCDQR